MAGDGLLDAVAQECARSGLELAAQCVTALIERAWEGDEELAEATRSQS